MRHVTEFVDTVRGDLLQAYESLVALLDATGPVPLDKGGMDCFVCDGDRIERPEGEHHDADCAWERANNMVERLRKTLERYPLQTRKNVP
jgi:hypothetical protein